MLTSCEIKAIIFDLDGTLVSSAEDLRVALNKLLGEVGLRSVEAAEIKGMIGDGVLKLLERALIATRGNPEQKEVLISRFLEIYEANPADLTLPYPGVPETLRALQGRQFQMALVTNKPVAATRKILNVLSLAEFFPVVVGGDTLQHRKPHPAPLLEAARQLGVDPGCSLMVGDNFHDFEAAHAAGMRCITVTYGYHHKPPSEFNPGSLIDHFDQLLSLV